ncbi:methyltransferase [Nitrospira sp. KM1]|nr:methyltransferase [Nitrospira sp. KM1]
MIADLYDHPDLYDALLPAGKNQEFYLDLARRQDGPVLELACGTGLLSVPIASAGMPTSGLDVSGPMLQAAKRRAVADGVAMEFMQGDMRDFTFQQRFDLVFIARSSLQHMRTSEDMLSTFAAAKRHLSPHGMFVFDVFNPSVSILSRESHRRFPVMDVATDLLGRLRVERAHRYDAATQISHGTWYMSTQEQQDEWVVPITVRCIFPQELPLLLSRAGLELVDRFGDLSGAAFTSESPKQICVCRAVN